MPHRLVRMGGCSAGLVGRSRVNRANGPARIPGLDGKVLDPGHVAVGTSFWVPIRRVAVASGAKHPGHQRER